MQIPKNLMLLRWFLFIILFNQPTLPTNQPATPTHQASVPPSTDQLFNPPTNPPAIQTSSQTVPPTNHPASVGYRSCWEVNQSEFKAGVPLTPIEPEIV